MSDLIIQFIPITVLSLLWLVPFVKILQRAGLPAWWAVVIFVPLIGLTVMLWVVGFVRWPREDVRQDLIRP